MKKMHLTLVKSGLIACATLFSSLLFAQTTVIDVKTAEAASVEINTPDYPLLDTYGTQPAEPTTKFSACVCNNATNLHKASRAGGWVDLQWGYNFPGAGTVIVDFSYLLFPRGGSFANGNVLAAGMTIWDNNMGGTFQIRVNCKNTTGGATTYCTSNWVPGSWTSGN